MAGRDLVATIMDETKYEGKMRIGKLTRTQRRERLSSLHPCCWILCGEPESLGVVNLKSEVIERIGNLQVTSSSLLPSLVGGVADIIRSGTHFQPPGGKQPISFQRRKASIFNTQSEVNSISLGSHQKPRRIQPMIWELQAFL